MVTCRDLYILYGYAHTTHKQTHIQQQQKCAQYSRGWYVIVCRWRQRRIESYLYFRWFAVLYLSTTIFPCIYAIFFFIQFSSSHYNSVGLLLCDASRLRQWLFVFIRFFLFYYYFILLSIHHKYHHHRYYCCCCLLSGWAH